MKNNKGFSLVELIIVIAIMAILVGVMAPQLIKYIEKSNVSADTQLADTVHSACLTAAMDPEVLDATTSGVPADGTTQSLSDIIAGTDPWNEAVKSIIGATATTDVKLKSTQQNSNTKCVVGDVDVTLNANRCSVVIKNSDKTGSKGKGATTGASVFIGVY